MKRYLGILAMIAFVGASALANYMTSRFGMIGLPFGMLVTAGTFAAGAVLILRDAVSETLGRMAVVTGIVAGAAVSWLTSPAMLALASALAFLFSELLDWLAYSPTRRRGWGRAVVVSSLVAAPIDTFLFLWVAGFPVTAEAIIGQWVIKLAMAALAVATMKGVWGAVLRYRVKSADA